MYAITCFNGCSSNRLYSEHAGAFTNGQHGKNGHADASSTARGGNAHPRNGHNSDNSMNGDGGNGGTALGSSSANGGNGGSANANSGNSMNSDGGNGGTAVGSSSANGGNGGVQIIGIPVIHSMVTEGGRCCNTRNC